MKKLIMFMLFSSLIQGAILSQVYTEWDYKSVEEFYEKISVKNGTLDEDGEKISCVFVPTTVKKGVYEVKISDYKNDLYEIIGTDYYVTFRTFGFLGYGKEGILVVEASAFLSKFYIKP